MARKPIAALDLDGSIAVICDDGAFLVWVWKEEAWTKYESVPGTPAHAEDEKK